MNPQKVKIQYGIFAGERHGTRLRRALRSAGYEVVFEAAKADIIMAHSAGCFWPPDAPSNQKLLLIDPPYWPGRSLKDRAKAKSKRKFHFRAYDYAFGYWIQGIILSAYYALRDLGRTRHIFRQAQTYDLAELIRGHKVLLVRNIDDDWLTPDLDQLKRDNPKLRVVRLPGDHDDITHHPERYVNLLQLLT